MDASGAVATSRCGFLVPPGADPAFFNESYVRSVAGPHTYAATSWTHSWEVDIAKPKCNRSAPTAYACCCSSCNACIKRARTGKCNATNLAKELPGC